MEIKDVKPDTTGYTYVFFIGAIPWDESQSMMEWCAAPGRLVGNWLYDGKVWEMNGNHVIIPNTLYFDSKEDATAFKLVWPCTILHHR
jgi:hypothetical protein